jgi:uncharacterized protein DUF4232
VTVRGLVLAALVVLCACGSETGTGSAAHASATPTAQPTAAPTATTGGNGGNGGSSTQPDRCHTVGLSLSTIGPPGVGAGNAVQEFGMTNRGPVACTFFGYVGMALIDASGNILPTRVVRDTGTRFPFAHRAQYTVAPSATAPFWVHWEDVPASQPGCTSAAGVLVTPPDETTQLRLDGVQIMACGGGELDVSPVTAPGTTRP